MRFLILLIVVVGVGWYGWTHREDLFQHPPAHEAVVDNRSGSPLDRVRIKVDGQTLVQERMAAGQVARLTFRVNRDSAFELIWTIRNEDRTWSGGMVPAGPLPQRFFFTIGAGNDVTYRTEHR